jgi:uncharacterized phiE125 gp8 family phage protein
MGLSLVTGPALEPVSLDEAKQHCRIDSTADDGLVAGYLFAARQYVELLTNRPLITQTFDFFIDRDGPVTDAFEWRGNRRLIELPRAPAIAVTSITYVDTNGATQTLAANQYAVDVTSNIGRIEPAFGVVWPCVRNQNKAITVRFTAGYGTNPGDVPMPINQAILLTVGHWYENRETVVIGQTPTELPIAAMSLIAAYRVHF